MTPILCLLIFSHNFILFLLCLERRIYEVQWRNRLKEKSSEACKSIIKRLVLSMRLCLLCATSVIMIFCAGNLRRHMKEGNLLKAQQMFSWGSLQSLCFAHLLKSHNEERGSEKAKN